MTPRPDLSNDAVIVETADGELSVFARPRYRNRTVVMIVIGVALSLLPMVELPQQLRRYFYYHMSDVGYLVQSLFCVIPFLLVLGVLAMVLIRLRRPRGLIIRMGTVTLFTPDDTTSRHEFALSSLNGALLAWRGSADAVDLQLTRRRGFPIKVLRGYRSEEIGHVVDLLNDMVKSDRSFAFEVVLRPQATSRPPPLPPSPVDPL